MSTFAIDSDCMKTVRAIVVDKSDFILSDHKTRKSSQ